MLVSHVQHDRCNWCMLHEGIGDTLSFRAGHVNQNLEIEPIPYRTDSERAGSKTKICTVRSLQSRENGTGIGFKIWKPTLLRLILNLLIKYCA